MGGEGWGCQRGFAGCRESGLGWESGERGRFGWVINAGKQMIDRSRQIATVTPSARHDQHLSTPEALSRTKLHRRPLNPDYYSL